MEPQAKETSDHPARRKKTPAWHWAVYVILMATTMYAVVLTYRTLPLHEATPAPRRRPEYDTERLDRSKANDLWAGRGDVPKDIGALVTQSIRAGTLEQQDKDPGDLPPPPGSIRRGSWRQVSSTRLAQRAVYEYRGTVAKGADHYVGMLLDKGFKCNNDFRDPGAPVKLHFIKGDTHAFAVLKKQAGETTITSIIFILLTDRNSNGTARQSAQED